MSSQKKVSPASSLSYSVSERKTVDSSLFLLALHLACVCCPPEKHDSIVTLVAPVIAAAAVAAGAVVIADVPVSTGPSQLSYPQLILQG